MEALSCSLNKNKTKTLWKYDSLDIWHVTSKLFSFQNSIKVQFNSYIIEHYGKIYIGPGVASTEVLFFME